MTRNTRVKWPIERKALKGSLFRVPQSAIYENMKFGANIGEILNLFFNLQQKFSCTVRLWRIFFPNSLSSILSFTIQFLFSQKQASEYLALALLDSSMTS